MVKYLHTRGYFTTGRYSLAESIYYRIFAPHGKVMDSMLDLMLYVRPQGSVGNKGHLPVVEYLLVSFYILEDTSPQGGILLLKVSTRCLHVSRTQVEPNFCPPYEGDAL